MQRRGDREWRVVLIGGSGLKSGSRIHGPEGPLHCDMPFQKVNLMVSGFCFTQVFMENNMGYF